MLRVSIVLFGALIGLAAAGFSQNGTGDGTGNVSGIDAIAARQASLDMSSITFRSIDAAVKTGQDVKSLSYPAGALAKWAKALPRMFPPGTGKGETSAFSQALPSIWKDRAGFDRAAAYYAAVTARLVALAQSSDTAGFTKQLAEVDQACAACHATYKDGDKGGPRAR
jgi:cytochrome c556